MTFIKKSLVWAAMLGIMNFSIAYSESDQKDFNQNQVKLTLEDAVKMALDNNISLKQEEITLNASRRASATSWNSISPSITGSASYRDTKTDKTSGTSVSAGGTVSMALTSNLYTTVKSASLSYQKEEITYENAVRTIEKNVRKSFYSLIYATENINLKKSSLQSSKNTYESILARYNSGSKAKVDVLSAQLDYQNAQIALQNARTSYNNTLASFKQTLGFSQETDIALEGSLEDVLNLGEINIKNINIKSSTLESLYIQKKIADNSLLSSRFSAYGPSLSASYGITYSGESFSDELTDTATLSLSASIPLDGLLPWSQKAQNIETAKDTIKNLDLQLQDAKTTLNVNVQNYLTTIENARENIKYLKGLIDLAQENYEMNTEAYNRGVKDILSLQTSSDSLQSAKFNLLTQANSLISTVLDLEDITGVPFGTLGIKTDIEKKE